MDPVAYIWLAAAALCIMLALLGRDASGDDGGADERNWRRA